MHSRTTKANRRRNLGHPSNPIGRSSEQRATSYSTAPEAALPNPTVHDHHRDAFEPRAAWHPAETRAPAPNPNPFTPETYIRVDEPRAAWHHAAAERPMEPPTISQPMPSFTVRQPESFRARSPTIIRPPSPAVITGHSPTNFAPRVPSPVPISFTPPSPSHQLGQQPPVFVSFPPDPVPHSIHPPRGILRRDSAQTRHRRPSGSGFAPRPPVVRVAPPVQVYDAPPAPSAYDSGQPVHRLPPWTWPEPPEPEAHAQNFTWSGGPQPPEPTWGPWRPSGSHNRNRSGRSRKGSQSSAPPPPGPHSPPIRSPPHERDHRPSSSFVANDPFKFQTPRSRRKREQSLNFDTIPIPGERTPTDASYTAEETSVPPVFSYPEGKIGSDVPSEQESGHSSSGSKSSKQSILSSTPIAQITNYVIPVVPFIFSTLVGQAYVHILLRLPLLYFSRVSRIFEEADLSVGDLKQMALEAGTKDRGKSSSAYELELAKETPQYERLKTTWGDFIDSVMREWKTFNVISVLLLSAILTILQIQAAAVDPITRYAALSSLLCALISLLYGCTYIIRFGTMRKTYKAFEWALEAKRNQKLWWNVWVMLAMPAIWLTWSIILYIACIMSFIWRTSPQDDGSNPVPLSPKVLLIIRILLSSLLGIGVLYGMLILNTFRRYGLVMDRTWQRRIDEWIDK